MNFSNMTPGDVETLTLDYRYSMAAGVTILDAVAVPIVVAGVDASPLARVVGAPVVQGTAVTIQFSADVPGVTYIPRVRARLSDGQKITLPDPLLNDGHLSVVNP